MQRVLIADKLSAAGMDILRAAPDIQVDEAVGLTPAELMRSVADTTRLAHGGHHEAPPRRAVEESRTLHRERGRRRRRNRC